MQARLPPEIIARQLLGRLNHLYDHGGTVEEWKDLTLRFAVLHYINQVKLDRIAALDEYLQDAVAQLQRQQALLRAPIESDAEP